MLPSQVAGLLFKVVVLNNTTFPGKGVAPFPTSWCSSYLNGSFRIALDYSRQLYLLTLTMHLGNFDLGSIADGLKTGAWAPTLAECTPYLLAVWTYS